MMDSGLMIARLDPLVDMGNQSVKRPALIKGDFKWAPYRWTAYIAYRKSKCEGNVTI